MFKNNHLKFTHPAYVNQANLMLPRVAGIKFESIDFYIADTSFFILGKLTVRNQTIASLKISYTSSPIELDQSDLDRNYDFDEYRSVVYILDKTSVRFDCHLLGDNKSPLEIDCALPIVLDVIRTSNFVEQLFTVCRQQFYLANAAKQNVEILNLFLNQNTLEIFFFYHDNFSTVFKISTRPTYAIALKGE